ncbi:SRPBCC family protein [Oryzobacter telluris]|uniref:SRPBCC family protein n=1 Tax=Oryzobacter telluris TaxID=3149179 RepID=UPI00370D97C3
MSTVERTITTSTPPETVFPYLVDFRTATEWDAGTVSCDLVSGDGGPGTVYRNVSSFMGNEVELEYTTQTVEEPRFVIVGRNDTTTSHDTITVTPTGDGGSTVVYRAEFTFTGITKFASPLLKPFLEKLGNDTAAQLKTALDRL